MSRIERNKELPTSRRTLIWWSIAAVALALWTAYWHWQWLQMRPALHGLVAFFLGLLLLILGQATVRLIMGALKNGPRWLWSKHALKLCGWTVVFAVSTVVLFYSIELLRGKRAWTRVVQDAKEQGANLELKAILPAPVPDEENFASAPFFAPLDVASSGTREEPLSDQTKQLAFVMHWERMPSGRVTGHLRIPIGL